MTNGAPNAQSRDVSATDDYLARLLKLLPAEITGAYLAVRTILSPEGNDKDSYIIAFAILIFIIAPFYMYFLLAMKNGIQILFLLFSYIVWVSNVEIQRITNHDQQIQDLIDQLGNHPWLKDIIAFMVAPDFIKGLLVIWVLLLAPFVFVKRNPPTEPRAG